MNNMPEISKSLVKPSVSDTPGNQPLEKNSQKNLLGTSTEVGSVPVSGLFRSDVNYSFLPTILQRLVVAV